MKLRSYAKINLTLDIKGKRPDSYHEIETIYQQINLYDEVEINKIKGSEIKIESNIDKLNNYNNICYKTAKIIMQKYNINDGVYIGIKKNIPIGAGLSGGSSNAAAVLKGMNYLFDLKLKQEELVQIAHVIGMDVAFHIYGGTCVGRGRGEIIDKIKPIGKFYVVVVYPDFEISSKDAYDDLDYERIGKNYNTKKFLSSYSLVDIGNDFELSIPEKFPEITRIKNLMGPGSMMTGSGSSVIGLFSNKNEAEQCYADVSMYYENVFLVETLNKNIHFANEMGICSGVKRALNCIADMKDKSDVYVLGSLVHNRQIIDKLKKENIRFITDHNDIDNGTIVISAHGVPDKILEELQKRNIEIIDLTCPRVKKLHNITKTKNIEGKHVVILGDENHVEILGVTGNLNKYCVIKDINDFDMENVNSDIVLVSQTTEDEKKFHKIENQIKEKVTSAESFNTICSASRKRQRDAVDLASRSDLMIVVGSKISANTKRLYDLCRKHCYSKHVETGKELDPQLFFDLERIGITAGASTPDWIIDSLKDDLAMMV